MLWYVAASRNKRNMFPQTVRKRQTRLTPSAREGRLTAGAHGGACSRARGGSPGDVVGVEAQVLPAEPNALDVENVVPLAGVHGRVQRRRGDRLRVVAAHEQEAALVAEEGGEDPGHTLVGQGSNDLRSSGAEVGAVA